jgi:simple sugar transport system permease protein
LFIAVAAVIFMYFFLYRTKWGYEIRVMGENRKFAHFSGINTAKAVILCQLMGGFIAGVGGSAQLLGLYTSFNWTTSPGFGWDGIIVAIIARNNPLLVPIGALFLAYIRIGSDVMSINSDVQNEVVAIIQGFMIMLIAAEGFLRHWRQKMIIRQAKEEMGEL